MYSLLYCTVAAVKLHSKMVLWKQPNSQEASPISRHFYPFSLASFFITAKGDRILVFLMGWGVNGSLQSWLELAIMIGLDSQHRVA